MLVEYTDLIAICLWEKEQHTLEVCYLVQKSPCSGRVGVMGSPFLHYTSVCTSFLKICNFRIKRSSKQWHVIVNFRDNYSKSGVDLE